MENLDLQFKYNSLTARSVKASNLRILTTNYTFQGSFFPTIETPLHTYISFLIADFLQQ